MSTWLCVEQVCELTTKLCIQQHTSPPCHVKYKCTASNFHCWVYYLMGFLITRKIHKSKPEKVRIVYHKIMLCKNFVVHKILWIPQYMQYTHKNWSIKTIWTRVVVCINLHFPSCQHGVMTEIQITQSQKKNSNKVKYAYGTN